MSLDEKEVLNDKPLMIKSIIVMLLVIAGFVCHRQLKVKASTVALAGAAVLLLISGKRDRDIDEFILGVESPTIVFLIGLFILVQGLVIQGWIGKAADFIVGATRGNLKLTTGLVLWVSALVSAFVNNIPFAATMIPMVGKIATETSTAAMGISPLWWALSLGIVLGGNATLTGAAANLISASISAKHGHPVRFGQFAKYGVLVTVVNMLICTAYLMLRHF
jgi:Na+/H+ antiporter NhaD/arsenite permease-like protein